MRKVYALLLLGVIVFSTFVSIMPQPVKADGGYAKVYIVSLTDVCGWVFGDQQYNPLEVKDGAVQAAFSKRIIEQVAILKVKFG